jgi:hypothetical protein
MKAKSIFKESLSRPTKAQHHRCTNKKEERRKIGNRG